MTIVNYDTPSFFIDASPLYIILGKSLVRVRKKH